MSLNDETRYIITETGERLLENPVLIGKIDSEMIMAKVVLLNAYKHEGGRNGNSGISIESLRNLYAPLVKKIESGVLSNDPRLGLVDESLDGGMKIACYLGNNVKEISENLLSMGCITPVVVTLITHPKNDDNYQC